ncbi:hypothetical protein NDU88_000003 [Pleurodeles waltl]|uniref:Uncharacterized protein n=1 Tax=Pleurodeles waltl TaxID=8319 RepID=A0AAV7VWA4_PLEWA|nr:hypothetical protein NDU88_000003 [Pleurodeles waltl]
MPSRTRAAPPHVSRSPRPAKHSTSTSLLEAQSSAVPPPSSSTSGEPTAGTRAQPKSPGSPKGRPSLLMETARHRRPGHQAQRRHHQHSPTPPGLRGPCPPGEARPRQIHPPGTNMQPGAPHRRELQRSGRVHPPRLHRMAGPPPPIREHRQPAPTEDRRRSQRGTRDLMGPHISPPPPTSPV